MKIDVAFQSREPLALRLDDVGASSKKYEVYSNEHLNIGKFKISGNWLFLKYLPGYKAWGPYREMRAGEWATILELLYAYEAKLTVAVTAAWVESETKLIPFPEAFAEEAAIIKDGVGRGLLEVANHGLTHCVVEGNAFKPKLFGSNRNFHREFGPTVDINIQDEHLRESQMILEDWLGREITTFVPPGNLFTEDTLSLAAKHGLRFVSANTPPRPDFHPVVLGNLNVSAFHDREIVLNSSDWLRDLLERNKSRKFCFVSELARERVGLNGH